MLTTRKERKDISQRHIVPSVRGHKDHKGKTKKKISFLEYAYELARQNGELLPHYITLEKFITDIDYFADFRNLLNLNSRIQEKLWNMTIKSADIARKDAMTA